MYGKSAYVYLNNMLELERQHLDVHTSFKLGKHVIRRSDRYWAGLSSDLVIEQVLMRSVKTKGILTRGRGVTVIYCHCLPVLKLIMPCKTSLR